MTAQDDKNQYFPKEPMDLPKEPLDLPKPHPHHEPKHHEKQNPQHYSVPREQSYDPDPIEQHYPLTSVKTLLSWQAPGRPFRKRGREYYLMSLALAFLFMVIAFLFGEYILMLVIAMMWFANAALVTVPPRLFHYRVSTQGVRVEDHFYLWQELYDFYFKHKENQDVLHVRTQALIPGELVLTLGDLNREQIKSALLPYLPFREYVKPTFMEKSGDWLAKTFPLEKPPVIRPDRVE